DLIDKSASLLVKFEVNKKQIASHNCPEVRGAMQQLNKSPAWLEHWTSKTTHLKDQRKLHDQLSAITTQLVSKGESLDSPWLLSKILSKFTENIQRNTLKEKVSLPPHERWTLTKLMTTLDVVIKQEEEIERHMPKQSDSRQYPEKPVKKIETRTKTRSPFCFYCESKEHWSTDCTKITAPKARLEHLKKSNRCIGCGSKGHSFAECKARGCMHCGKKHHTSTCFKSSATHEASKAQTPNWKKEEKQKSSKARQNLTLCEEEDTHTDNDNTDNFTVMKVEDASHRTQQGEIFLLSGALRTLHPRTKKFVKVSVLLDTGADRSFIDERLAKKLQLPNHGQQPRKETQCIKTCMNVWDSEGEQHKLQLYTHTILTRNISGGKLQKEDLQYIHKKQITLSSAPSGIAQPPEVLIGCDQLWNFIKFEAPHFVLPSGLKLIPTSLGYMVTGKRIQETRTFKAALDSSFDRNRTR
ncbi:zinc knuckle, partial [Ostertagia ostertagi]